MDGEGGGDYVVGTNPDSSASLVFVPHLILPENTVRPKNVVPMHECYIFFLVCLAWPENVSLFAL